MSNGSESLEVVIEEISIDNSGHSYSEIQNRKCFTTGVLRSPRNMEWNFLQRFVCLNIHCLYPCGNKNNIVHIYQYTRKLIRFLILVFVCIDEKPFGWEANTLISLASPRLQFMINIYSSGQLFPRLLGSVPRLLA